MQKAEVTEEGGVSDVILAYPGREGKEGGRERERKRKLSDKFLCIFLQSYTNFRQAWV